MHKSIALISMLALLAVVSPAQAQTEIAACSDLGPGNYVLTQNISTSSTGADCLDIFSPGLYTIDLGGFTISVLGALGVGGGGWGIKVLNGGASVIVRNGTIFGPNGISTEEGMTSVIEGVRVQASRTGIRAIGVVKDNVLFGSFTVGVTSTVSAGTITGNYIRGASTMGISVTSGSTVIGNTVVSAPGGQVGLQVACPSNVINNTSTGSTQNLFLTGQGCNEINNVVP